LPQKEVKNPRRREGPKKRPIERKTFRLQKKGPLEKRKLWPIGARPLKQKSKKTEVQVRRKPRPLLRLSCDSRKKKKLTSRLEERCGTSLGGRPRRGSKKRINRKKMGEKGPIG